MIGPQLLEAINELARKLGYLAIDGDWGTTGPPADLRVPITAPSSGTAGGGPAGHAEMIASSGDEGLPGQGRAVRAPGVARQTGSASDARKTAGRGGTWRRPRSARLEERLRAGLADAARGAAERRGAHGSETFVAVAVTKDPECPAEYWLVDLDQATVTPVTREAQQDSDWDVRCGGRLGASHRRRGQPQRRTTIMRPSLLR